ncbi:uncharacterized protein [Musca autumnalis]|uniref:uncharacterized protein n=1 Tax=Musca autumnalis TaxID=221902 RepID=UPI003CEB430F
MRNVEGMNALDKLLKKYDDKFICRYLEVRFLLYLQKADEMTKANKMTRDKQNIKANECMSQTTALLTPVTEWILSQLHPELLDDIPQMQQIFDNIVKGLNRTLRMHKNYIIPDYRIGNLETIQLQVGNLPQSNNTAEVLKYVYESLNLQNNNYYHNYLTILKYNFDLEVNYTMDMLINIPTSDIPIYNIGPKYELASNRLILPFGVVLRQPIYRLILPFSVLRQPIYHPALENIFKQSSLGTLMAQQILDGMTILKTRDTSYLEYITSLHTSFDVFFSSLELKEAERLKTMFNLSSLQELKQMFFINAIHYRCEKDYEYAEVVNSMLMHLSDFNEAFDCKLNMFLKNF